MAGAQGSRRMGKPKYSSEIDPLEEERLADDGNPNADDNVDES